MSQMDYIDAGNNNLTEAQLAVLGKMCPELLEELDGRTLYTYQETGEDMDCMVSLEWLLKIARRFLYMAERLEKAEDVFLWLLGEKEDFPTTESGKRYIWRKDLREKLYDSGLLIKCGKEPPCKS